MRGGKLIAFLDSSSQVDSSKQNPMMGQMPGGGSSLDKLLKAWGLQFDTTKVVADRNFTMNLGEAGDTAQEHPVWLALTPEGINSNDIATAQLDNIWYFSGGAFTGTPAPGLKETVLLKSTTDSQLVDSMTANFSGENILKDFKPSGNQYALAVRLTGKFKTAFPDGIKGAEKPAEKQAEKDKPVAGTPALRESASDNSVILVADVDMLADGAAVDIQDVFGRKVVVPSNGNLAFALGMVEQFAAGNELISLRSRATAFRPLTVVRELEAEAQQQYFGKIQALEEELQKTNAKLQELQKAQGAAGKGGQILSAEQQAELERFRKRVAETRLELKEVRRSLRQDAEALVFWTKVVNIALMPILVALAGLAIALIRRRRSAA